MTVRVKHKVFITGIAITALVTLFITRCFGQTDTTHLSCEVPAGLKFSYNSSVIYPGLGAGMEFKVGTIEATKIRASGKIKNHTKDRFVSGNIGWYHHPGFHNNIYVTAGWEMRRTKPTGFFTEFSSGAGYSRTFLGGTTYRASDDGKVSVIKGAGYNYALVTTGGGVGYDFSKTKHLPLSLFATMNFIALFPYNSIFYLRPVVALGIVYRPQHFIGTKITKKSCLISKQK